MKKYVSALVAAMALLFCLAQGAVAEPTTHEIVIRNFNFYPPDPVIDVGDTVVWQNTMNYGHWVISGVDMRHDNKFFSYLLLKGHKFSYTFRTPGDFPYYCPIHSMQAMVSVVGKEPAQGEEKGGATDTKRRRRRR